MTPEWLDAGTEEDLDPDQPTAVVVAGRSIALYRVDDAVYATDSVCSHGNANLCDGFLEGHEIECPLHQGRFDVRTGKALCAPLTVDIRVYPVQRIDGRIQVAVEREST